MFNLQQIINSIPHASTDELHQVLAAVQNELPKRDGEAAGFIEHIPDFCCDGDLIAQVWDECESLDLSCQRSKAATQWISPTNEPYIYPDSNPIHNAKPISDFPYIRKLLSMVNESNEVSGPLDACLLIKYNSNQASLSLHADDEPIIDQNKSICSFSIGSPRTIEFFQKSHRSKLVKKIRMEDNSLVVMRPGTQQQLKHCVRSENKKTDCNESGFRYSLSFRGLMKCPTLQKAPIVVADNDSLNQEFGKPIPPNQEFGKPIPPKKYACLIAGDSYAAHLDKTRLGKGKIAVENVAEGGSKISGVRKQLEKYARSHLDTQVNKLIISVGTNDIRNARNGINHLRGPLKELCTTIKDLFPHAKVFFQSLLPLPLKHSRDWLTNTTVIEFNWLIYNECSFRHFYYIDAFNNFSKFNRNRNDPPTRFDEFFEINGIHPNPKRGMGVLARLYLRALHSRYFNPFVFQ